MKNLLILAAFAFVPVVAGAQFTAVITPPEPEKPATVAQVAPAVRDSLHNSRMTNMREWVDSAATAMGVATDSTAVAATVTADPEPEVTETKADRREERLARRESAGTLPDTASPYPFLAILGATLVIVGAWLARPREARAKK